ncbi:hypothetical protein ABLE91_23470 [Aquabacter sp. CN5-332]|uniref:hypothetical protein n=1 Tax=Aquabacter sp. CN5-332 TaxID=3156608 RepID=UPI0032B3CE31
MIPLPANACGQKAAPVAFWNTSGRRAEHGRQKRWRKIDCLFNAMNLFDPTATSFGSAVKGAAATVIFLAQCRYVKNENT